MCTDIVSLGGENPFTKWLYWSESDESSGADKKEMIAYKSIIQL